MKKEYRCKALLFHQGAELYGSDKIFFLVAKILSKKVNVKVILDSSGPLLEELKKNGISDVDVFDLAVLRRRKLSSLFSVFGYFLSCLRSFFNILSVLKKYRPEYVYVNTLAVLSPLVFSKVFRNAFFIHHIHEIQTNPKFLMRLVYSFSALFSDKIICVSQAVKECYLSMSFFDVEQKISVINNGLPKKVVSDSEIETLKRELDSKFDNPSLPLIAYVARVHTWKGQIEFIDSVKFLRDDLGILVNVAFFGDVFPGYEYIADELQKKIDRLGLSGQVNMFGFRSDAPVLFALSDISIMGSIFPDPLPTIVLESMQQGTPVIAYAHGGSCEMIVDNKNGVLVPPGDVQEMARSIKSLVLSKDKLEEMSKQAIMIFNEKFSYSAFEEKVLREIGVNGG